MKEATGDLIALAKAGDFDVIVHGCNAFHTMGAGIAKQIKFHFPEAYAADLATPKGEREKLGTISTADIEYESRRITVVNAYTQFSFGGSGINADYGAIRRCFAEIRTRFSDKRIGYPLIGAGLAGGSWTFIASIINEELSGCDHTLVRYKLSAES